MVPKNDKKARSLDNLGTYFNADLMSWNPENKVNVVFSMEVLYYFENPQELIKKYMIIGY